MSKQILPFSATKWITFSLLLCGHSLCLVFNTWIPIPPDYACNAWAIKSDMEQEVVTVNYFICVGSMCPTSAF